MFLPSRYLAMNVRSDFSAYGRHVTVSNDTVRIFTDEENFPYQEYFMNISLEERESWKNHESAR
jgi:hypothetical protein